MMNTKSRAALLLILSLLLTACATFSSGISPSLTGASPQPGNPSAHSQQGPLPAQPTTTLPPPRLSLASLTPTAASALPPPSYHLAVQVDYGQHTVQVKETITEANRSSENLTSLVLPVEASRTTGVFRLASLQWGGGPAITDYKLDKGVLTIPMAHPIPPQASFTLVIEYDLKLLPSKSWLAVTGRQLNLGDWYPFLPPYKAGKGWLVHEAAPVGEYLVYPAADYQVDLAVGGSAAKLVVAASAPPETQDGDSYHYRMQGARGFALSISPEFQVETRGKVTAYYFAEHARAARASLETASAALDIFSELYGAYPYPGLALVEGDFFDGMEYTGLFFLGTDYFADYPGSPLSYLTPLSAHETAHQWWYSLVGDDPALEPWLDEALCTYSEQLYFEKVRPDLITWWRFYRIDRYQPAGRVDSTIYNHPAFRPYVDAVYLRGAQFLDALRAQMGDEAFRMFVKELASRHQGGLLTGPDFWALLKEQTGQDYSDLAGQYFGKNP